MISILYGHENKGGKISPKMNFDSISGVHISDFRYIIWDYKKNNSLLN